MCKNSSHILCVTNRLLCTSDFKDQIRKIAVAGPKGIILREKDLSQLDYQTLAGDILNLCREYELPCILHHFVSAALNLNATGIHLSLPVLRTLENEEKAHFSILGASCHSLSEAREAESLGCTYITAGHIFPTDCKKDLPSRGLPFLEMICNNVTIPVYAIGGILPSNYGDVLKAGATGACSMSGFMRCSSPTNYLSALERSKRNEYI
ncbi:MAG: thiamine phosphate synthase [Lachnospiraceae bacterium]